MDIKINEERITWDPKRLLIAGYTGKDQDSVKRHIEELKEIGVPAPPRVPMIYDLTTELLTTENSISVVRKDTSGEAEVVLVQIQGKWFIGLGSDHTDRVLEAVNIQKSKQVCSKPISAQFWSLDEVENRWDEIEIKSWVIMNGEEREYQLGKLEAFLSPKELLSIIRERGYDSEDMVVFCGTLPLLAGEFIFGDTFRAELYDRLTDRRIELSYDIKILKDAEEV
ncbi:DUF2848 family protein [Ammoniphilus sp. YIM 78166]|uniref:DUF2848 family protein n=1 Tax=Ammoniphilus sp. YIM 78166 TaxID=1644106 RepID=UPI00106F1EF0|nr:DUF2848 family protein [Ammoniphilus sp. YIM 78166]